MECEVKRKITLSIYAKRLLFVSLFFILALNLLFPTDTLAQRKGTLKPETPTSQSKKQTTAPKKRPATQKIPLVPEGKQADITIFATGNVLGYIEPCG